MLQKDVIKALQADAKNSTITGATILGVQVYSPVESNRNVKKISITINKNIHQYALDGSGAYTLQEAENVVFPWETELFDTAINQTMLQGLKTWLQKGTESAEDAKKATDEELAALQSDEMRTMRLQQLLYGAKIDVMEESLDAGVEVASNPFSPKQPYTPEHNQIRHWLINLKLSNVGKTLAAQKLAKAVGLQLTPKEAIELYFGD